MAKTKISEFSATPANNTDIDGINIAEGCPPSGINNAIRELMAQLKDQQSGTSGDNFSVGGNLAVTGTTVLSGAVTCSAAIIFSSTVALGSSATATTQTFADDSTKIATTEFVQDAIAEFATDLADPGSNGIVVRTAEGTTIARSIQVGDGMYTIYANGVDSDPFVGIQNSGITSVMIANANVTAEKLSGAQSGSAPIYGCRAWASFGYISSAVAINGNGNIASITRSSEGLYVVTFTTAMPNANYSVSGGSHGSASASASLGHTFGVYNKSTTGFNINITDPTNNNYADPIECGFSVFG